MITVIVQFETSNKASRADVVQALRDSVPRFQNVPGLIRKYYLYGEDSVAGGAYLWESRAAAEALYTPEWCARVAGIYGGTPRIAYFETPVVIDNSTGEVIDDAMGEAAE